jgi:hypothetical protein
MPPRRALLPPGVITIHDSHEPDQGWLYWGYHVTDEACAYGQRRGHEQRVRFLRPPAHFFLFLIQSYQLKKSSNRHFFFPKRHITAYTCFYRGEPHVRVHTA